MKKLFKNKNMLKKVLFLGILVYVAYILIGQQKTINSYKNTQNYYSKKIQEQLAYQETLIETKNNIDSPEYIEEIAREKLDMYLPNETIYVDKSK